jgi:hypothetical protein
MLARTILPDPRSERLTWCGRMRQRPEFMGSMAQSRELPTLSLPVQLRVPQAELLLVQAKAE